MQTQSLFAQTSLIFDRFNGHVIEHDDYLIIQTPNNPGFHWGNYILFKQAPKHGDYQRWCQLFKQSFPYYQKIQHMAFAWEETSPGETQEFIQNGFELEDEVTLATSELVRPPKFNEQVELKALNTDQQWEEAIAIQLSCADEKFANAGYEKFKREQMKNYQKMDQAKLGHWYGAYLNHQMVGDLGIFHNHKLARFQNVGTHPQARRQGVCQSLVYQAACSFEREFGVNQFVMVADPNYHAAKIYESVGFKPVEKSYQLSWWTSHI